MEANWVRKQLKAVIQQNHLDPVVFHNSEFVVMLNQAPGDQQELAKLFHISQDQMSYISNAEAGCGLIRYGSTLIPFENRFPRDTDLYRLMTTRPNEKF